MNLVTVLFLFFSNNAFASSGGFTFIGDLSKKMGLSTHIEHVLTFVFIALIIFIFGLIYRIKISKAQNLIIPAKGISLVNIVDAFGTFVYGLCRSTMGEKEAKKYFSVIAILFIFIFLSNLIGLVPGFLPPTDNINTTLALGVFVFIYYNYQGIKEQGLVGHIKHFMGPVWYMAFLIFPIELISHAVRPISLALRLRGNMFGDHLVLSIFSDLVPILVPVIFIALGLFVCFIQAFVFSLLTMVYISLATATHDHEEHAH